MTLKEVGSWMDLCQLNISGLGTNLTTLQQELCQLQEEDLVYDVRSLLGLDLLRVSSESVLYFILVVESRRSFLYLLPVFFLVLCG